MTENSNSRPLDGIYFVRVHESLVEELRAAPSDPVTVTIEERGGGELLFVFTRHDCPNAVSVGTLG